MNDTPQIRLALAKGRVAKVAINLLEKIGWSFPDYSPGSRKLVFEDSTGRLAFFLVTSGEGL